MDQTYNNENYKGFYPSVEMSTMDFEQYVKNRKAGFDVKEAIDRVVLCMFI